VEVTQKALAECLGVTPRQIRNLKSSGLFTLKPGEKKYHLEKCIQEYIAFKVNDETGRRTVIDKEKVAAEHEEVKREISLLKLRKLRRELHESADVESYLMDMLLSFRNRLEALPQKAAMQVVGIKDVNEIIEILRKIVNSALNELSKYDPDEIDGQQQGTYEEDMEDLSDNEEE
jgi:phage terminase Nu1 subunit (DNA packaging protein)